MRSSVETFKGHLLNFMYFPNLSGTDCTALFFKLLKLELQSCLSKLTNAVIGALVLTPATQISSYFTLKQQYVYSLPESNIEVVYFPVMERLSCFILTLVPQHK